MKKRWTRINAAALSAMMVITSAGVLPTNVMAKTDSFETEMEEAYAEPEMKYRPYARWWLAEGSHSDETLEECIQELYEANFGGVEFVALDESAYLDDETYAWGSDEWIHDSQFIIKECQKRGMSVSMTGGTNWSTANLVSITPDQEEAAQELGYRTVEVPAAETGVSSYTGELPTCALPSEVTKQTLVAVIAAKTVSSEDGTVKLDMDSMTDVTASVTEDNGTYSIEYTAPDGDAYELFAFYQYGTGESYKPAISNSYTINYLDKRGAEALIEYWDANILTEEVQEVIDQMDECDMYMDSLELNCCGSNTTGNLWSADMLKEFSSRRGYDMTEVLPFLIFVMKSSGWQGTSPQDGTWGRAYEYTFEPADEEDQEYVDNLRKDFYQTLTDLYQEDCLDVLADWLHSKNMKLRAEVSYGKNFEISEPVSSIDYLETESFEYGGEIESYRSFSGAAHMNGIRLSCETGASMFVNYARNNNYYRQLFYTQYAAGIQKTITHGYSAEYGPVDHISWPGYEGMNVIFPERFSKRQPAAVDYKELWTEMSRIQKVLEQGVPQMDIAMLRTDYGHNNSCGDAANLYNNRTHNQQGYYWKDMELQNAGYTYEYFSPYLLEDDSVSSSDQVLNADGVAYQALIVMEEELPYDAAVNMLKWAEDGLPILFVNNVSEDINNSQTKDNGIAGSTTGSNDGKDADLAKVVAEMKALPNVKTVESTADAYEALQALGVRPRAEFAKSNDTLLTVTRKTDEANYLYVYNYMYEAEDAYQGQISVDGMYEPYILNTWSGDVSKVADYEAADGRTTLNIDIEPGEVAVYILKKTDASAISVTSATNVAETMYVDGQLTVAVDNTKVAAVALSDGTKTAVKATGTVGKVDLADWNLKVTSYEPGEKETRTITNEATGVTTTEAHYTTNYVEKDAGTLTELLPWKDIEAVGPSVSGVGTYTSTFTLPAEWNAEQYGVTFKAESICGGTMALFVNGEQVPVDMNTREADITAYAKSGENQISVRVTSTYSNVLKANGGYSGWSYLNPAVADYGMTGDTSVTVYEKFAITSDTEKKAAEEQAKLEAEKKTFAKKTVTVTSLKSSKKKTAVVSWKKISGVKGYEVRYSTQKAMTKYQRTTTTKTTKTLTKLTSKKYLYVKVRAYKYIGGQKVYTKFSARKSVKVK